MNQARAQYLEGYLVRILTIDGFQILDYYQYNEETGELFLEANSLTLYDDEIASIEYIDDMPLPKHINKAILIKSNSLYEH